jgi:hypothetical protein
MPCRRSRYAEFPLVEKFASLRLLILDAAQIIPDPAGRARERYFGGNAGQALKVAAKRSIDLPDAWERRIFLEQK